MVIGYLFLVFICFILANQIAIYSRNYNSVLVATKKETRVLVLYSLLLIFLILFSGLRTSYNDTQTYMYAYSFVDPSNLSLNLLFSPYGGFEVLQCLLKLVTDNPQILIFISAVISNSLFLWFYAKYGKYFGWIILGYLIIGPYMFSMGGIKQILAMSFSLLAIDNLLRKNKLKFWLWLIFASFFHPYIICIAILPILDIKIWSKKLIIIIAICVIASFGIETILDLVGIIGKEYTIEEMTSHTINPIRVLVEFIPVIYTIFYRKRIKLEKNRILNLGINMLIINAVFISLGLFANPIYFARIGTYFSSLNAMIIPIMLFVCYKHSKYLMHNYWIYYSFFLLYFLIDQSKLGTINILIDQFNHINIFGVF